MTEEYFLAVGARGGGSSQYLLGRGRMHTGLRAHIYWSTSDVKRQGTHVWRHPWRPVENIFMRKNFALLWLFKLVYLDIKAVSDGRL